MPQIFQWGQICPWGPPSGLNMVFHTSNGWDLLIIVTTALTCQDILHKILYPESYTAGVK